MLCHASYLQLYEYGYIPPPLPGGQCYPDAAVALPGAEDLSAQLSAQLAALQAILSQLKSSASEGIDQLALQEQLSALQQQVDTFSTYVSAQASSIDTTLQAGLLQLQDSLSSATVAVSSFVDTQLQQLDIPGKLAYVLDVLRKQEQALVEELPRQFAELQRLAATATGIVQETALQAATAAHLPELLASLDKSMGVLHDVLELRVRAPGSVQGRTLQRLRLSASHPEVARSLCILACTHMTQLRTCLCCPTNVWAAVRLPPGGFCKQLQKGTLCVP